MQAVMADEIPSNEGLDTDAPARLVNALKRVQPPAVNVPPQIDTAALSRAHLHFARMRQQAGGLPDSPPNQDLPLAALTGERTKRPVQFTTPGEYNAANRFRNFNWNPVIAICAIILVLIAIALLVHTLSSGDAHRGASPTIRQTPPP